jgi:hypothetical protein
MANHSPVILATGNHAAELEGNLYVFGRRKGERPIYICTEPELIELAEAVVAVFPYRRKAEMAGNEHSLGETSARQLPDYLNAELPVRNCRDLERHLKGCETCSVYLKGLKTTVKVCRRYQVRKIPAASKKVREAPLSALQRAEH